MEPEQTVANEPWQRRTDYILYVVSAKLQSPVLAELPSHCAGKATFALFALISSQETHSRAGRTVCGIFGQNFGRYFGQIVAEIWPNLAEIFSLVSKLS